MVQSGLVRGKEALPRFARPAGCPPDRLSALRSQLPWRPLAALPCSQTPGGPPRQTIAALRRGPRYSYNEGSTINKHFGAQSHGFTTRCLRLKPPFRVANQGSLPVDGQSFPGGMVPAGSHQRLSVARYFMRLLSVGCFGLRAPSPPLRALAGAKEFAFGVKAVGRAGGRTGGRGKRG